MSNTFLNLAFVISELDIGGAEKNFTALAIELKTRGHRVHVYSIDPPDPNRHQSDFVHSIRANNIPVEFLTSTRPNSTRLAAKNLKSHLENQQPDVVQSFLFRANLATYWAATKTTKFCLGIRQAENRFYVRAIENYLIRRASHSVFVSRQVAKHYRNSANASVIPNAQTPVNLDQITSAQAHRLAFWQNQLDLHLAENGWIHLYVGRMNHQKNVVTLVQAMDLALTRFPNDHFVLIGSGDLEPSARSMAKSAKNASRIHFAGWQQDPQLWIRHADLLVLMSRWEGMPNVLLESMAAAKPFVSYPTHGVADIFFPEVSPNDQNQERNLALSKQVAPIATPDTFLKTLTELRNDVKTAENIANWNYRWLQTHFSVSKMVDSYEHLFRQLAGK